MKPTYIALIAEEDEMSLASNYIHGMSKKYAERYAERLDAIILNNMTSFEKFMLRFLPKWLSRRLLGYTMKIMGCRTLLFKKGKLIGSVDFNTPTK